MDWWLILIIFIVLVVILWWALSRQTEGGEAAVAHHAPAAATEPDDLTKVEGIGPKVKELLHKAGISTFAELAKRTPEDLDEILDAAGSIYRAMDASSWPKQAGLAAAGKWEELEKLQEELVGGR